MRRAFAAALSALAVSAGGCNAILGIGEPGAASGDGGVDPPLVDAGVDAPPASGGAHVTAGFTVLGTGANTGTLRVVEQRLESLPRVCTTTVQKICVIAGITP